MNITDLSAYRIVAKAIARRIVATASYFTTPQVAVTTVVKLVETVRLLLPGQAASSIGFTDTVTTQPTRGVRNTTRVNDSATLRVQSYAHLGYFAEDYVGAQYEYD